MAEKQTKLQSAAFALESVAHLRGLERELLPQAEFLRKLNGWLAALEVEGPISSVLDHLRRLAKENNE